MSRPVCLLAAADSGQPSTPACGDLTTRFYHREGATKNIMKGPIRIRRRALAVLALMALLALSVLDLSGMTQPGLAAGSLATAPRGPVTIAPEVLRATANGGSTPIVILLAEQANLSSAYNMRDE